MTTLITPRAAAMFTSKSFVVMLMACLSVVLLSWTLSTQVFFGQGFLGLLGMVLGPFIVGILFLPSDVNNKNGGTAAFFAMLMAVGIGAIFFATSTDSQMSTKVGSVNNVLKNAADLRGTPPAFAAEFAAATKDAKTARANAVMVNELLHATSQEQVVVNYIAAAKQFDLDATFVASNGIVRQKDRQALYRRAMDLSGQGNQQAVGFLQNNDALALR